MDTEKNKDPLHGVTIEQMLTELQAQCGWEGLAEQVNIRCFQDHPSIASSLKFLRRTPWARTKVERLYLKLIVKKRASAPRAR